MSPFSQATESAQEGAVGEAVIEDHCGVPERLGWGFVLEEAFIEGEGANAYDIEVTAQPRLAAALHMRLPGDRVSSACPCRRHGNIELA